MIWAFIRCQVMDGTSRVVCANDAGGAATSSLVCSTRLHPPSRYLLRKARVVHHAVSVRLVALTSSCAPWRLLHPLEHLCVHLAGAAVACAAAARGVLGVQASLPCTLNYTVAFLFSALALLNSPLLCVVKAPLL